MATPRWRQHALEPRNTMYDIEILPSVVNIPKETWDSLAPPDDPLWRWSYFKVMETSGIGPDGFEYIVFRRDRRIVAILPAFWFNAYRLSLGLNTKLDNMAGLLFKFIPGLLQIPVYFCGHPMGEGRILKAKDTSFSIESHVLETMLLKTVWERAWARGLRWIIFKDYSELDVPKNFPSLESSKFFSVPGLPDARLKLSWPSFEDYVRERKPNARKNIRKRLNKFAKFTNLRIETLDTAENISIDMMPLYRRVMAHAKLELDRLTSSYFSSLSKYADIKKKFIACFDGERLIGFVLCLFASKGAVCLRG